MIHTCAMGFSLHDEGDQAGVDIVACIRYIYQLSKL